MTTSDVTRSADAPVDAMATSPFDLAVDALLTAYAHLTECLIDHQSNHPAIREAVADAQICWDRAAGAFDLDAMRREISQVIEKCDRPVGRPEISHAVSATARSTASLLYLRHGAKNAPEARLYLAQVFQELLRLGIAYGEDQIEIIREAKIKAMLEFANGEGSVH